MGCKVSGSDNAQVKGVRFTLTMWDVKWDSGMLGWVVVDSFTLTMWDVKWKNLGPVNEDIEAFYLNYVGCKVIFTSYSI